MQVLNPVDGIQTEKIIIYSRPSSIYTKTGLQSAKQTHVNKMLELSLTLSSLIVYVLKSWMMGQNTILHHDEHF